MIIYSCPSNNIKKDVSVADISKGFVNSVEFQSVCGSNAPWPAKAQSICDSVRKIITSSAASSDGDVSCGDSNTTTGQYFSPFGFSNKAGGSNGYSAFRYFNKASGALHSSDLGSDNTASGSFSSALGVHNTAKGRHSLAIGYNNAASGANSIAIGQGAQTMRDGFVSW